MPTRLWSTTTEFLPFPATFACKDSHQLLQDVLLVPRAVRSAIQRPSTPVLSVLQVFSSMQTTFVYHQAVVLQIACHVLKLDARVVWRDTS